jgi:riboflavin kinase / FMN adenylyltransferase
VRFVRKLDELKRVPRVISIGVFDGVHLGHQHILKTLVAARERENLDRSLLISFDPHPLALLRPDTPPRMISTLEERVSKLEGHGPDELLVLPFTHELASTPFDVFAREILLKQLGMRHLVAGYDFRMGKGRGATAEDMAALGEDLGFRVEVVTPCYLDGEIISSTRIRAAVNDGDLESAADRLGRPFSLSGKVIRGDGRGRGLGFPTANLETFPQSKLLPPAGVYRVRVRWEGAQAEGLMNLGMAPTLRDRFLAEIHLLDFKDDLYGIQLDVDVLQRFRSEEKFSDVELLRAEIARDVARLRSILESKNRE